MRNERMQSPSMLPAIRGRLIAFIVVLAASYAVAQQSTPTRPAPAETTEAPATDAAAASGNEKSTGPDAEASKAPAKPAAAQGSPQRFEPTEKVRPDFDVAFPVDI
jgi:hypothetical protein